jgi:glycosyltransferase involved in cell wall biosynthesis
LNILLINHYAGSTQHGMEYRPYYLAREWLRLGHQVQILAASHSHVRTRQPEMNSALQVEILDGIQYHWYQTPAYVGNGIGRVKNMFAFVWAIWRNAAKIASEFKPDVVIASSTYPMDIWAAHRIAKRANAKLVFEVHDLWPLSPMELGGMSKWHPFIMLVQQAEDYAYKYADCVISMLPKAKAHMESRGMKPTKFHYIPNGVDTAEWENSARLPDDVKNSIELIKQRGKPIIGYAGTHGLANALDTLLDAAKLSQQDFEVVLVGNGPERDRLAARVQQETLNNVTLLPAIPKATIPAFLRAIDIAYIGLLPEPLFRFGISPNKLMDYMMAGKPIVHAVEAGNDPVAEAGCGLTVQPENPEAIAKGIRQILALSPAERTTMGQRGHDYILQNNIYPILAKDFLEIMQQHISHLH